MIAARVDELFFWGPSPSYGACYSRGFAARRRPTASEGARCQSSSPRRPTRWAPRRDLLLILAPRAPAGRTRRWRGIRCRFFYFLNPDVLQIICMHYTDHMIEFVSVQRFPWWYGTRPRLQYQPPLMVVPTMKCPQHELCFSFPKIMTTYMT